MRSLFPILLGVSVMAASPTALPQIAIHGEILEVTTATLKARFEHAALVSLTPLDSTVEFIHASPPAIPLGLLYQNNEVLGQDKHQGTVIHRLGDLAARIDVRGADSTRSLLVRIDPGTGDLCVTPDGLSARRALRSVRWSIAFHPDHDLILPCVNGILVRSATPYSGSDRFEWPYRWNAQLVIAEGGDHCMMVHCEDRLQRWKALSFTRKDHLTELGFESEVPGPIAQNRTAGGIEWHLSVSPGDWTVPAGRYRDDLRRTHELEGKRTTRPDWIGKISLAQSWADPNPAMLDALASVHPPSETLIHLANWRTDKYDVNYPVYTPTEEALAYLKKASDMGFHVMPHFNYFSVYYENPFFQEVGDFQVRSVDKNEPQGWHWPPESHDYTRMGYIHPGLGLWRNKLLDVVIGACDQTGTGIAFLDQTLCTWNSDNGLVQGLTTVQGLHVLQEQFHRVRPDLVIAGEGLNEISFDRQAFAQAHIHNGWGDLTREHVEIAHSICSFLWEGHTRLIGYYGHLNPENKNVDLCIEVYRRMGAIPTFVTNNPQHLLNPSESMDRILAQAKELSGR